MINGAACSGKNCPIQYPFDTRRCGVQNGNDCPYFTPELSREQAIEFWCLSGLVLSKSYNVDLEELKNELEKMFKNADENADDILNYAVKTVF